VSDGVLAENQSSTSHYRSGLLLWSAEIQAEYTKKHLGFRLHPIRGFIFLVNIDLRPLNAIYQDGRTKRLFVPSQYFQNNVDTLWIISAVDRLFWKQLFIFGHCLGMPEKVHFSNYKAICIMKKKTTKHSLLNIFFEHTSNINLFFYSC